MHIFSVVDFKYHFYYYGQYSDEYRESCDGCTIKYEYPESDIVDITPSNFSILITEDTGMNIYAPSDIERYCIERLIKIYELYNKYNYSPIIRSGYYGEDVLGTQINVPLNNLQYGDFFKNICRVVDLSTDIKKIKYILSLEGIAVDDISDDSTISIQMINPENINMKTTQDMVFSSGYKTDIRTLDAIGVMIDKGDILDGVSRFIDAYRIIEESGESQEFPVVVIKKTTP